MLRQRGKDVWRVMHAEAKGSLPPGRLQRLTLTRAITLTSTVSGREQLLKKTTKHPFAAVLRFSLSLTALSVRRRDGRHTGHAPTRSEAWTQD